MTLSGFGKVFKRNSSETPSRLNSVTSDSEDNASVNDISPTMDPDASPSDRRLSNLFGLGNFASMLKKDIKEKAVEV